MSEEVLIAIIGAAAVVLAAIIGGVFMYISQKKKKNTANNPQEGKSQELNIIGGKVEKGISQKGRDVTKQKLSIQNTNAESVNQENF